MRQVKSSSVSTLPHRNLNETRRRLHGHRAPAVAPPASLIQLCVISPPLWSGLLGLLLDRGCLGALAPVIPASSDASFPARSSLVSPNVSPLFKPTFLCWSAARCGTTALPHLLVYCRPPFSKTGRFSRAGSTSVILRALLQDTYRAPTQSWSSVGVHRTNKQVPSKLGNCEVHMVETKDSKRNRTYIAHVDETGWEEWS